jgi:hypothetical protein
MVATQGLYEHTKKNLCLWCSQNKSIIVSASMSDTVYIYFLADSSAAKSAEKNKKEESPQAAADSTATEDNSNDIRSCCKSPLPGSNKIPAVAMIQLQQKLSSDEHVDQTLAVTSVKEQTGQQSSMQACASAAVTIPVSLTYQTAAKTARPTTTTTTSTITATTTTTTTTEVIDIRGKNFTSKC